MNNSFLEAGQLKGDKDDGTGSVRRDVRTQADLNTFHVYAGFFEETPEESSGDCVKRSPIQRPCLSCNFGVIPLKKTAETC